MARRLLVTPAGQALWPVVQGEAVGFEDGPRAWSISLLLEPDAPATIAFIEQLEAAFQRLHGAGVPVAAHGWPFAEETVRAGDGRPVKTGKLVFKFRRRELSARGNAKDPPLVVDGAKQEWPVERGIGNGSTVKVAFDCWGWDGSSGKGMSLELEAVQVLDLVPSTVKSGADVFDAVC